MNGDEYRQTVLRHKDRVHSYATWILRDTEEARDVAQEALVRLWKHSTKVRPETAKAWLLRTTHNLCIDQIRKRRSRPSVDLESWEPRAADQAPGPDRRAAAAQTRGHIERALQRLTERDRAVVLMREVEGLTYEEIAEVLAMPLGTLKAVLHRARQKLRRHLTCAGVQP